MNFDQATPLYAGRVRQCRVAHGANHLAIGFLPETSFVGLRRNEPCDSLIFQAGMALVSIVAAISQNLAGNGTGDLDDLLHHRAQREPVVGLSRDIGRHHNAGIDIDCGLNRVPAQRSLGRLSNRCLGIGIWLLGIFIKIFLGRRLHPLPGLR